LSEGFGIAEHAIAQLTELTAAADKTVEDVVDVPSELDRHLVFVEIADTGVGISEADLRLVFRPLFSTMPRGTGLGLSFCRQAVEEHGGEIRLASRGRDRGTIATVSLLLAEHFPWMKLEHSRSGRSATC
jgi:signal transduction histidine kinase